MKYFIVSDCHSFFTEMKKALDDAGFDSNNKDHIFIGAGDFFDRGRESQEMLDYLNSLERKVLVRGNHEDLMIEMIQRGYAGSHDFSNGTMQTVMDLSPTTRNQIDAFDEAKGKLYPLFDSMVDYFEGPDFIVVHSFIPLETDRKMPYYHTRGRKYKKDENWRNSDKYGWQHARWGNPFELSTRNNGEFLPDKTLIFGHWHTSYHWAEVSGTPERGEGANYDIFYGDGFIGLDACTVISGKVNCLIIDERLNKEVENGEQN